ncbi:S8 family serine peptidase [Streptomyces sp. NRRL S-813]|uniref:S8 family peptidase n=1 Tax=Streptomyces sp. NRRL S-813 TaxID=1463919 RepID=UPI00099B2E80
MPDLFKTQPTGSSLVQLEPDVIPPLGGIGRLIGPQLLLVGNGDLAALAADVDVRGDVYPNLEITFQLDPIGGATTFIPNEDNWGVGPEGLAAKDFWDKGVLGQRVRVGIADSGLDSTHPAFADLVTENRIVGFAHFNKQGAQVIQTRPDGSVIPDSEATPTFGHLHGTHCAAIVAGQPTDGKERGVAPGAELAVTRVLEESNTGSVAGISAGLWWLTTQSCDIVSLSLGWPGLHEDWAAPIKALLDAGVVVVAAVGNEFDAAGVPKSRSPANYPLPPSDSTSGLLVPVGAHDRTGAVWVSSGGETVNWTNVQVLQVDGTSRPSIFSAAAEHLVPSMVAPGVEIVSAAPGNKYCPLDGSSMATPHIAGLVALILSHLRSSDPVVRPRAAADLLFESLQDISPPGPDIRSGDGRIDNGALLQAVLGP